MRVSTRAAVIVGAFVVAGGAMVMLLPGASAPPVHFWVRTGTATTALVPYDRPDGAAFEGWRVDAISGTVDGGTLPPPWHMVIVSAPPSRVRALLARVGLGEPNASRLAGAATASDAGRPGWTEYVDKGLSFPERATADAALAGDWETSSPDGAVHQRWTLRADGSLWGGGVAEKPSAGRWGRAQDVLFLDTTVYPPSSAPAGTWFAVSITPYVVAADGRSARADGGIVLRRVR